MIFGLPRVRSYGQYDLCSRSFAAFAHDRKWPQAAYPKSRCAKAKGALRVMGKRRDERRLNLQQQALSEISPMSLLGLERCKRHDRRNGGYWPSLPERPIQKEGRY